MQLLMNFQYSGLPEIPITNAMQEINTDCVVLNIVDI